MGMWVPSYPSVPPFVLLVICAVESSTLVNYGRGMELTLTDAFAMWTFLLRLRVIPVSHLKLELAVVASIII